LAQARRLEIDTAKWLISKLSARKYGDRLDIKADVSANVSATVTAVQFEVILEQQVLTPARLQRLSDEQFDAWKAAVETLPLLMAPLTDDEAAIDQKHEESKHATVKAER
jgi:hypothetical protein